jgi:NADH:ubiquinone oxidoreductase subunit F (NADH-binding)
VAAHVVGAERAYIAIKASFAKEIDRLRRALGEMASAIAHLPVELVEGPEEYLFGEEKALLEVIEGNGPLPREAHYPPYEVGLFATPLETNPCVVNNVETYAHVPSIVRSGAKSFREIGTQDTPGTLIFTLSGELERPGVYEAQAGIPLETLIHEFGGGPRRGRKLVAALSGVSTGVLPANRFRTPADFGSLALAGSGLGSAGFVLLDDATSIPRVAQAVTRFLFVESCNQCSACKAGLRTASRALDTLFEKEPPRPDVLDRALFGARSAPQGNRCYLPVQASFLVPSLADRFKSQFDLLARRPAEFGLAWLLPKMIDYDPQAHVFKYDERQAHKLPDWSYDEPPAVLPRPAFPPAQKASGDVSVRIASDLAEAFAGLAEGAGTDLGHEVDVALREWLARRTTAN